LKVANITEVCLENVQSRCQQRQATIVSKDDRHGYKHIAHNHGSSVRQYKMDGEVLPKGEIPERCDFLLINDDACTAYYIELKGSPSNADKCIAQVESTEKLCRHSLAGYKSFYRFIFGRGHGGYSSKFIAWRDRKDKNVVKVGRDRIEEDI